jgi:hypothetical protein
MSNGNSLSPLGHVDPQGSRAGRLEPLYGQQNRFASKHLLTKSGGMSAMTQHDDGEFD